MYIVTKSFSGVVSGTKGKVIELKDKKIIKELLRAGYIEEYNAKTQSSNELKKENEALKKTIEDLEKEIADLKTQLEEAQNQLAEEKDSESQPDEEPKDKTNE